MDKGKRITGAERDRLAAELRAAYEGGASIRSLADRKGRLYGFVHHILAEAGVTQRRRGGVTSRKPSS
ncbi:helix-turn-helix domain-containing protein [Streptomyces sp. NPDC059349]|uniref:helix-turn-helix domain-containing protein n=1 Tax=Streptomyces sp. NPDC059349 TaxID=3346808 RepID=UPI0036954A2D